MSTISEVSALPARLREFVRLTEEKRALESDLRKIGEQLTGMEPGLLEDMALAGMASASVDGFTIFTAREFTCGLKPDADKAAVFAEWLAGGHANLVMLGWSAMRSMVKEASEAGEALPEAVAKYVETGEQFRLRARKAS